MSKANKKEAPKEKQEKVPEKGGKSPAKSSKALVPVKSKKNKSKAEMLQEMAEQVKSLDSIGISSVRFFNLKWVESHI